MSTGPQKYPGAVAGGSSWYQDNFGGDHMEVNCIVLHTTEGTTLPTYSGGAVAPNFTAVPDFKNEKLVWYQHFDFDVSSRALVNKAGGVETNTNNVTQIELVGTCDPSTHKKWGTTKHIYWPEAPDWALEEVAKFLAWANKNHGVPLSGMSKWAAYPGSYGVNASQRMSMTAWNAFRGICGHQHVPENDHGDPGAINFAKLLQMAKAIANPVTPPKSSGGTPAKPPTYQPFPGASLFQNGKKSPIIAAMHKRLVAVGCNHYQSSANSDVWGSGDKASYAAWQRKRGFSGNDADGIPGKTTWDALKVPHV